MNDFMKQADRLLALPPYVFSEINAIKAKAEKEGKKLLSLAIGDPDLPTPPSIIRALQEATSRQENHVYSPYEGTLAFRKAAATWFQKRFQVELNPENEVLALIGSKEGIAHFPLAFCNVGDVCLYPSPGYPIFETAITLAGGKALPYSLAFENGFKPDINKLEESFKNYNPKYILINYPSNPTSAVCDRKTLEDLVSLCIKYQVILVSDNAYSEMYFDKNEKPISVLEIPRAKEVAIEFHSFSKTYNMTGWRLAFAVGNAELIKGLLRAKTNIDSGPLLAVQEAGIFALQNSDSLCEPIRNVYYKRRELMLNGLKEIGIEYFYPKATFFVWAKVPLKISSMDFTKQLIEKQGLVVTPGMGFGAAGEGFFRLSLTVSESAIADFLIKFKKAIN